MKFRKLMRDAHIYVGLFTSLIVLMLSITGFLMNDHKAAWGLGSSQEQGQGNRSEGQQAPALSMSEAMTKGVESGVYKAREVRAVFNIGSAYRVATTTNKQFLIKPDGTVTPFAEEGSSQFIKQLHKGYLMGYDIRWTLDVGAIGLVILTGSGVYLYIKMLLMKRKKRTKLNVKIASSGRAV